LAFHQQKSKIYTKSLNRASLVYQFVFEDPNSFYRLYREWVKDGKLPK